MLKYEMVKYDTDWTVSVWSKDHVTGDWRLQRCHTLVTYEGAIAWIADDLRRRP